MSDSSSIIILIPTFWEARSFIRTQGMKILDDSTYLCHISGTKVILQLCGIGRENAKRQMEKLTRTAPLPALIISAGFAGALQEKIHPGDLAADNERSDPKILGDIVRIAGNKGAKVHQGKFYTSAKPLFLKEEKIEIAAQTNAIAVEMESEIIFQMCREKKIPFLSFRAISDGLNQKLPKTIQLLGAKGNVGHRFWLGLISHPEEWRDFFTLLKISRRAGKNLSAVLSDFAENFLKS